MGDSRFKIKNGLLVEAGPTEITGSVNAPNITGSLFGTSSWALNAVTASFALNAGSGGLRTKVSGALSTTFAGSPRTSAISFTTSFPSANYSVSVTGEDSRAWSIENKSSTGFTINSNSDAALSGTTYWIAVAYGES